jgi:cytochrome c-type biogenesis protein CcmH/NrfG
VATKKQQRRRQKLKRHEYEEVYVDDEGNVLDPEEAEQLVGATTARRNEKRKAQPRTRERAGRHVDPPSWRRTFRRGLLFFPLMLLVIFLLSPELSTAQKVVNTLVLMAFFIPFSYFMDRMMWRSMQRRLDRTGDKKP